MTEKQDDDILETYLEGDSSISRGYAALENVEPPKALDRVVLAMAESAARETKSARKRQWRWNRWLVSGSLAATLTISIAVVVRVATTPDAVSLREAAIPRTDSTLAEQIGDETLISDGLTSQIKDRVQRRPLPSVEPTPVLGGTAGSSGMTSLVATPPPELSRPDPAHPSDHGRVTGEIAAAAVRQFEDDMQTDRRVDKLASNQDTDSGEDGGFVVSDIGEQGLITVTGSRIQRVDIEGPSPESVLADSETPASDRALETSATPSEQEKRRARQQLSAAYAPRTFSEADIRLNALMNVPADQLSGLNPEDWLTRIGVLRERGDVERFEEELALFRETHPYHSLDVLARQGLVTEKE